MKLSRDVKSAPITDLPVTVDLNRVSPILVRVLVTHMLTGLVAMTTTGAAGPRPETVRRLATLACREV